MTDTPMTWDTATLYPAPDGPELETDLKRGEAETARFRAAYRGQVAELDAAALKQALVEYEALHELLVKPQLYAHLLFAADSGSDANKRLSQRTAEYGNKQGREILFFDLELIALEDDRFNELAASPLLAPYRHYLESLRRFRPHTLTEREESLLAQKGLTGVGAFSRLFDELSASLRFTMELEGEVRELTGEELLSLLHHPDAAVREQAFTLFLERHAELGIVYGAVFNNAALDHSQELELRSYGDPMEPTHLGNELPPATVERLMAVSEENYPLARDYFRLKARLLGMERLKNTDIYAPLPESERRFSYDEARELVLEAYTAFDPEFGRLAKGFFSEGRIDVLPRPGKSGGAFCMGMTPRLSPYLLLNFTGTLRDVSTLAHEMGHGIHFMLAQEQTMLNYHPPLPLAETASVFGEICLTRLLLEREDDRLLKRSLLCAKIEDIIATTFRQNVLTRFEERMHRERAEGLLTTDRLGQLWWEENGRLYGDAVEMVPAYRWGWSYISHFIHSRFYCYSYTFAELLVLALYQRYRAEGAAFIPVYRQILASGGSLSPAATVAPAGIDLADPHLWQQGYDLLGDMIGELKELVD
jgi:oligoendopeptidase F